MKKNIIGIVLCLATTLGASAEKPGWQWAQIGNDGNYGWGIDIVVAASGNIYVTGSFTDTLTISNITLNSAGDKDIFWAKYDANGQLIWAKSAGSSGVDEGIGIAVDSLENIYVGSYFSDGAVFGTSIKTSTGLTDLSLAKYDSSGNQIWVKTWGSIYEEIGSEIFFKENHLYLIGKFSGYGGSPTVYGTIDFDSYVLTSYGDGDVFILKTDTAGNVIWAAKAGGKGSDYAGGGTIDRDKNIFITGRTGSGKMIVGNDTLFNKNFYIAKYDSSGNGLWVKGASGTYAIYGMAMATDSKGNAYVVGHSHEDQLIDFGSVSLSGDKGFITKYNSSGNLVWAKNVGENHENAVYSIKLDAVSNIYITGLFNYKGFFGTDTLLSYGADDILVAKYDSNGNHIWAVQAGGGSNDGGYGIALDNNGNIVVAGYVSSAPAYFGSHTVSAVGYWDMFVAKLSATTGLPVLPADDKSIRVYPNPAPDIFTVQFEKGFSELRVYDMQGRVVEKRELYPDQKEIRLDGSYFSNGIYYLQLTGKAMPVTRKIIIQH